MPLPENKNDILMHQIAEKIGEQVDAWRALKKEITARPEFKKAAGNDVSSLPNSLKGQRVADVIQDLPAQPAGIDVDLKTLTFSALFNPVVRHPLPQRVKYNWFDTVIDAVLISTPSESLEGYKKLEAVCYTKNVSLQIQTIKEELTIDKRSRAQAVVIDIGIDNAKRLPGTDWRNRYF